MIEKEHRNPNHKEMIEQTCIAMAITKKKKKIDMTDVYLPTVGVLKHDLHIRLCRTLKS